MVEIIAEAGVAHFGSIDKAIRLARLAHGADYLKAQAYDPQKLTRDPVWRERLKDRAPSKDILWAMKDNFDGGFCFTVHERSRIPWLEEFDVPFVKVGSGELGNLDFVRELASLGRWMVISTGMYSLQDIEATLTACMQEGNSDLTLLHCVTEYPVPDEHTDLNRIADLMRFGCPVGYSDHSRDGLACYPAIALGAEMVERHIGLKEDFGRGDAQDWKCSSNEDDFPAFMANCRRIDSMMLHYDCPVQAWATKSLYATMDIEAGAFLQEGDCVAQRPGGGYLGPYVGLRACRPIISGEMIAEGDLR